MLVFTQDMSVKTLNGVKEFKKGDEVCDIRCDIVKSLERTEKVAEKVEPKKPSKPAAKAKKSAPENKAVQPDEDKGDE